MKFSAAVRVSFIISLLTFFLFACKKDNLKGQLSGGLYGLEWKSAGCDASFDAQPSGGGSISTGNQYKYPTFNNNNPYEFICYKIVKDSGSTIALDHQIIKYNIITRKEVVLRTNTEISGYLAWNKYGWIAFKPAAEPFIHILKDDGTALTKFSNYPTGNFELNLHWLDNENTLLWGGANIAGQIYLKRKSIGDDIETLIDIGGAYFNKEFAISSKNILMSQQMDNQLVFNLTDLKQETFSTTNLDCNVQQGVIIGKANWHVDGTKFYVSYYENEGSSNLYEINYINGNATKMLEMCQKEITLEAVCVPNGKYLILQKLDRQVIVNEVGTTYGNGLIENYSLSLYDPVTKKEARIFN